MTEILIIFLMSCLAVLVGLMMCFVGVLVFGYKGK